MEAKKLKKKNPHNLKIDLGCGRVRQGGFVGIDVMQYTDGKGEKVVDIVRDVEKHGLPFCDNSAIEIKADSVLEHFYDLEFVMNECHRVLKKGGVLRGVVPHADTEGAKRDPTHRRFFVKATFDYFTGVADHNKDLPAHPRYARYGFLPWIENKIYAGKDDKGTIIFNLSPRK